MPVLDFLRDVGKHFPVNRMLARDVVRNRLEDGISYTEFSYVLLQSMDYLELFRTLRLHAAVRRQRPVGQHHRRRRAGPAGRGRPGARPGHAAADQGRRDQVRQDRGGHGLARPGDDLARTPSTSSSSTPRTRRSSSTSRCSARAAGRRSTSWTGRPRSSRTSGPRSRRWPTTSPPWCTPRPSGRRRSPPRRRSSGAPTWPTLSEATLAGVVAEIGGVELPPATELPSVVDVLERSGVVASQVGGPAGDRRGRRLPQQRARSPTRRPG